MTWNTYGTWLPGDERGWVKYRHGFQIPSPIRELEAAACMTENACVMNPSERCCVHETIGQHCQLRNWELLAVNCRTNHVHCVVVAAINPDEIRKQFKAWCTRRLKELHQPQRSNCWAERGSCRWINDENSLEAAILYVRDGQTHHKE